MIAFYTQRKGGNRTWNLLVFAPDGELLLDADCASMPPLMREAALLPLSIVYVNHRAHRWSTPAH